MRSCHAPKRTILAALAFAAGGLLSAQSPKTADELPKHHLHGTEVRLPSELRTGAPELVGLERGSSGFRDRTPVLAGRASPVKVDVEQLRQRRLATYGDAAAMPSTAVEPGPVVMAGAVDLMAPSLDPQASVRLRLQSFRIVTMSIGAALLGLAIVITMRLRRSDRQLSPA